MKKCFLILAMLAIAIFAEAAPRRKVARNPRFSPLQLNGKLAFTRGEWSTETVWTMKPDGSGQKQVWRVPKGYGQFGGFNRAGTQALSYNGFNVYLHDLKTHRLRRLFVHSSGWGTYINSTSFSRDGKHVVFAAGGRGTGPVVSNVIVLNLQRPPLTKAEMRKLGVAPPPNSSVDMHEPRLSTNGQRLVVSMGIRYNTAPEMFSEAWNIWTLNTDGSAPRRVTSNPSPLENLDTFDKAPCFSPDGKTIAFVRRVFHRGKGESNDIWFVDAVGANERRITAYEEAAKRADIKEFKKAEYDHEKYNTIADLQFSSDGKQIAFNQTGQKNGIFRIDTDGRSLKRLTDGKLVQWVW